ncbi:MAG: hypothetical protein HYU98_03185 [Deltaproteobacteria bacterium]|nr:hypothetical protein [Deltaproteobacteria bacterium]
MKPYKLLLLIGLFTFIFSNSANAFNSATDCDKIIEPTDPNKIQALLDYNIGKYPDVDVICFTKQYTLSVPLTITSNATPSAPLLIYGLNLTNAQTNQGTNALLQLSGSNITLDHATLTGPGSGTAMQVTGQNMAIQSSTISNFATGIQLGTAENEAENITIGNIGAEINITNVNTGVQITNAKNYDINNIKFTINTGGKKISPVYVFETAYFGIKCNNVKKVLISGVEYEACDASSIENNVKTVIGRSPLDASSCSGDSEKGAVLYKNTTDESVAYCKFEASSADIVLIVPGSDNYALGNTIKAGNCLFECIIGGGKLMLSNLIGLEYVEKNADGQTKILGHGVFYDVVDGKEYYKYRKYLSTADNVQSTGLGGIINVPTTTLGANGDDGGTTVYVPGLDTGASVAEQADSNNEVNLASADESGEADTMKKGSSIDPSILPPSDTPSSDEQPADGNAKPITIKDKEDDNGDGPSQGVTGFGTLSQGCSLSLNAKADAPQVLIIVILLACMPAAALRCFRKGI